MSELMVVFSGFLSGAIMWLPCSIGIAAHRYELGGAILRSTNRWVLLSLRPPRSFSILGRLVFALCILAWFVVFLGAATIPFVVADTLGVPDSSSSIGYAILANLVAAAACFIVGRFIWRKVAYGA